MVYNVKLEKYVIRKKCKLYSSLHSPNLCNDGLFSSDEIDIDCGGLYYSKCIETKKYLINYDYIFPLTCDTTNKVCIQSTTSFQLVIIILFPVILVRYQFLIHFLEFV
jgi:hypothetical protein